MPTTPTAIIYLALPTSKNKQDGKTQARWQRIGAIWKNKSGKGSSITWDFTPVPTGPGGTIILPYEERKKDTEA
jgi:hypothetical protein